MNKRKAIGIAIVALILVIAGWAWLGFGTKETADIVTKVRRGFFKVTVTATGELQAKSSIEIVGPMNARMANIWQMKIADLVPEGTVVKAGDYVAELDKSEISTKIKDLQTEIQKAESRYTQTRLDTTLTLSQARNELITLRYAMEESELRKQQSIYEPPSVRRQAEIDFEKARRTFEQEKINYVTKADQAVAKMEEVQAELQQRRQKLDLYNDILGQFTIKAPADGMLIYAKDWEGKKKVVNSTIDAWGPTVATLPDLTKMESITYVNEVDIQKIKVGLAVEVGLDADPDKKLTGKITEVANVGEQRPNSDSKVFEVKIEVDQSDSTLRPAMTTSNEIVVATAVNALFVPLECIHSVDSLTYVYKKLGLSISRQEVQTGLMNENEVIIKQGLAEDDEIYMSTPPDAEQQPLQRLAANHQARR